MTGGAVPAHVIDAALEGMPGWDAVKQRWFEITQREGYEFNGLNSRRAIVELAAPAIWDAASEGVRAERDAAVGKLSALATVLDIDAILARVKDDGGSFS